MIKYSYLLAIVGILLCFKADAQNKGLKWGLGLHPSSFSFYALQEGFFNLDEYEHGIQFSINRYVNKSFDFGVESSFAVVRHPAGEDNPLTGGLWRDFFYDANPFLKYKFYNGYMFKENSIIMPSLKVGIGINKYNGADLGISAPVGLGLGFRIKQSSYIILQTSYNLGVANSESYLHHSLGFVVNMKARKSRKISPEAGDSDSDGIPDYLDRCPRIKAVGSKTGCPDMDGDGVLDVEDQCPTIKGYSNLNGCLDSDRDGVADPADRCPSDFGTKENYGCPQSLVDRDGDLISDKNDKCPGVAGHLSAKGCPDRDADGIVDDNDNCPDVWGLKKYNGCPYDAKGMTNLKMGIDPEAQAYRPPPRPSKPSIYQPSVGTNPPKPTKPAIPATRPSTTTTTSNSNAVPCDLPENMLEQIGNRIKFDSDKAKLKLSSKTELDKIVTLLSQCGQQILIRAHTDTDGDNEYNRRLSERRAYAVSRHLMKEGIDRSRIRTEGVGESEPISPNDTETNKDKNRRIEFIIVK